MVKLVGGVSIMIIVVAGVAVGDVYRLRSLGYTTKRIRRQTRTQSQSPGQSQGGVPCESNIRRPACTVHKQNSNKVSDEKTGYLCCEWQPQRRLLSPFLPLFSAFHSALA